MAKKKAVKAAPMAEEPGALDNLEEIFTAEQLNPALAALYGELGLTEGAETKVIITMQERDGVEARVWNGVPDDYDLDALAKQFGDGDYRVKIYVKVNGKSVVQANRVIRMKLSPADHARLKLLRDSAAGVINPMMQQPAVTADTIAAAIARAMPQPVGVPAMDFPAMLRTVADMAKAFMPVAPAAPAAQGMNALEMLKTFGGLIKDMRAERAINDDDDDGPRRGSNQYDLWGKLIDRALPMFAQALQVNQGGMPASVAGNGMPQENPIPLPENPAMADTPEVRQLKMGVAFLIAQADAGHDPVTYADVVLDQVPEEALRQLVAMPDPVAHLAALDARITGPIAEWFRVLLGEVKTELEAPDDAPENPPA